MIAIVRQYNLNPIFESDFRRAWFQLMEVYKASGGLQDFRLHRESSHSFVSYETWSSKSEFQITMNDENKQIRPIYERVCSYCNYVHLLHTMEILPVSSAKN
jgi:quinol monooxygenase YgiN